MLAADFSFWLFKTSPIGRLSVPASDPAIRRKTAQQAKELIALAFGVKDDATRTKVAGQICEVAFRRAEPFDLAN